MFSFNKRTKPSDSEQGEHREQEDRRYFKPEHKFPIMDNEGQFIKKDRRRRPERRLSNIEVEYNFLGPAND